MTLVETLLALRRCGVTAIRFDATTNTIGFSAPPGAVSPELRCAVAKQKAAILALLRRGVTRPTIADLEAAEATAPSLPLRRPVLVDGRMIAAIMPFPAPHAPPSAPPMDPPAFPETWYTGDQCDAWLLAHGWRRGADGAWIAPDRADGGTNA